MLSIVRENPVLRENPVRQLPDIVGVKVYPGGTWVVVRNGRGFGEPPRGKKGDGTIKKLSFRARARMLLMATETGVEFRSMMTLTYGLDFPRDGKRVKSDLNKFLNWVRRVLGCEYLWFLEFQKRGAPHVHILLAVESGDRYEFAKRWCEIASDDWRERLKIFRVHSNQLQWQNARREGGMIRYVAKYATKPGQKIVPRNYQNVGRFWGVSKGVAQGVPDPVEIEATELELRDYLRATGHRIADWETLPKVIFGA